MEEDGRAYVGHPGPAALVAGDPLQQAAQPLGLAVGQQQRVLDRAVVVHPRRAVAGDPAAPVLELDQVQAVARQHEEIDLIGRAVVADELQVGPGPVGVRVGDEVADGEEAGALVRELRWGDFYPAGTVRSHVLLAPPTVGSRQMVPKKPRPWSRHVGFRW
ncbi:MAG: hypothetical protein M3467_05715 [Actinomycetota bacterium]|nr:hypothetical protein [Actinomycetota bacterium]